MPGKTLLAGSVFEYSTDGGTTWTEVVGLTEWPEFRNETEEVDTTEVRHTVRQFDPGLDSPSEQTLTARYYQADADQRGFRDIARANGACSIRLTYSDTDIAEMDVTLRNYGIGSGGPADYKTFTCTLRRTTDITFTEA